jgi:hypothetical protein
MMLLKRTREYGIPSQPLIPPMPEKYKHITEREFIIKVLTLASEYNFNCCVRTDNISGSIGYQNDVMSDLKKSNVEINDGMKNNL